MSGEVQKLLDRLNPEQAEEFKTLALTDPMVHAGLKFIESGTLSIENALVSLVMILAQEKKDLLAKLVEAAEKAPALTSDTQRSREALMDMARRYDR